MLPLYKNLKILAVITTLMMVFVQIGGALVTKTGSADGCGQSWPLCHGQLIPSSWPIETIIELAHRGVSGLAIILVGVLGFLALKLIPHKKETRFLVVLSIGFILIQALIGAGAVVWGQNDFILAAHFGISLISFASVFLLMLLVFEVDQKFEAQSLVIAPYLRYHTIFLTIYIYLVVYSGALVRHTNSSLACLGWPHCGQGQLWASNFYQWVQMSHRVLAGIIVVWILIILIHVLRNYSQYRILKYGWIIAFVLVLLQALTGMLSVLTLVNIFVALLHALFITLLFGLLCYFILLLYRTK
ncbi:heme A synthase [Salinicoccus sesuvii]